MDDNDNQNVGQNEGQKIKADDRRKQIIEIMKLNSKITAYDLYKKFNVTERTIEGDLKILTDEKTIEYVVSAKSGHWRVNE